MKIDRKRISKESINSNFSNIVLFLCMFEFVYDSIIGNKTSILHCLFFIISFLQLLLSKYKFNKKDFISYLVFLYFLLYSKNNEGIRYFLLLVSLHNWRVSKSKEIIISVEIVSIISFVMCVIQRLIGYDRSIGILNSPTQMSCVLWICLMFLMVIYTNTKKNKYCLVAFLCLISIWTTETRSSLLAAEFIFFDFVMMNSLNKKYVKYKIPKYIALSLIILIMVVFFYKYSDKLFQFLFVENNVGSGANDVIEITSSSLNIDNDIGITLPFFNRKNQLASTNTRIYLYKKLLEVFEDLKTILIGKGGGFVESYFKEVINKNEYFPSHQDFLLLLVEYGLLGYALVTIVFIINKRKILYFLLVFFVCSFHNIVLNPSAMMFMCMTWNYIEKNNYKLFKFEDVDEQK